MKPTSRGFTLVELLVVIAIIAVLAAAGFAGGNAAMNKARKVSAQSVATSIATGVEQFYNEYSALPSVGSAASSNPDPDPVYATDTADGVAILNILAGRESTQNARKIRSFSAKEAKGGSANPRDGATYDADNNFTGLYDPWGEPYYIAIDTNYNDILLFTPDGDNSAVTLRGRKVAAYSLGVDTPADSNSAKIAKSW